MLTIWGRPTSDNCTKVFWVLAELGLHFTLVETPLGPAWMEYPELSSLNPNGLVPLLQEDEFVLWESNCIVRYLSAKHSLGNLYPRDLRQRAIAEQWMDWQTTTLEQPLSKILWNLHRLSPEQRDTKGVESARQSAAKALSLLDAHLATREFVAGDSLTMGDIPVGVMAYRWFALDIERPKLKHLEEWYERLRELPGYRTNVMRPLS